MSRFNRNWILIFLVCLATAAAHAQSFRVQCPTSTITHPAANNDNEPAYTAPTTLTSGSNGYLTPQGTANGAIKCQQISGGDGFATMADGTQTYMFSFGPLSGLADLANGLPGTEPPSVFNSVYPQSGTPLAAGDPATTDGASAAPYSAGTTGPTAPFTYNGAIGLVPDAD